MDQKDKSKAICKQVEYYFSDANIVRDSFLKNLLSSNGGWAPLEIMQKFNRIAAYKTTTEELAEILKQSKFLIVEKNKVRRATDIPESYNAEKRSVVIKRFPSECTLSMLETFFEPFEDIVARIFMRRDKDKTFTGDVILEMKTEEQAKDFLSKNLEYKSVEPSSKTENESENEEHNRKKQKVESVIPLKIFPAEEYIGKIREKRQEKRKEKKEKGKKEIIETFIDKIFQFTIEKTNGEKTTDEETEELKISDIKKHIQGTAFVDIPNKSIRMKQKSEQLPEIEIKDLKLKFRKLTAEEVEKYCDGLTLDGNRRVRHKNR